jgi:hypothetical protein
VKSPLYSTDDLPGGQLFHVLWRWHVGLLSKNLKKKKKKTLANLANLANVVFPSSRENIS